MALRNHQLQALQDYLPDNTLEDVLYFMHTYKIHLKLRKDRKSILGDYRPAHREKPHTISINISLNRWHFLITYLHEVAHLVNHLNHGRNVSPHGKEWKTVFALLLKRFTDKGVFPDDLHLALQKSLQSPAASTCSDPHLFRVLHRYDDKPSGHTLVENIGLGNSFQTLDGRKFTVHSKRRTRYECVENATGKRFLFPGIYEVRAE